MDYPIPREVADGERIARSIYHPLYFKSNDRTKVLPIAYRPPYDKDEISVDRFDYSDIDSLKKAAVKRANPSCRKNYFGFAVLIAREIREIRPCYLKYSPILNQPNCEDNISHADIHIGYTIQKQVKIPSQINYIFEELSSKSMVYDDNNGPQDKWGGLNFTEII